MSKKGFLGGKNSNAYIIFYASVMVILVAAVLAVTSLSLKDKQDANILNEKKNAIVLAMGLEKGTYDNVINAYVVDKSGAVNAEAGDPLQMLFDLPGAFAEGKYPVFENKESGEIVLPLSGKGLWGPVWGYMALKSDVNTIKGVIFDHSGETPGLGAEIATPKFWAQFPDLTIYEGGELVGINVVKGGAQGAAHSVDAISGGTKTSEGLQAMIKDSLGNYDAFMQSRKAAAEQSGAEEEVLTEKAE